MKFSVSLFFQNYRDWERYEAREFSRPSDVPDWQVWADDGKLGDLAEPLGYDGIWSVEHHFTPYTMTPDVLQLLSYFAGRTKRIDMGSMVVVLPWHDPVRVAEQLALLDIMLDGRKVHIGFGRGAGEVEFNGFRVPMGETRGRFAEALEIVRRGLSQERFSFEGEYFQIPEMTIRPRPRSQDLLSRMYCAWQSPETLEIAARLGLGMLFTVSRDRLADYADESMRFNAVRQEVGLPPLAPKLVFQVYCAETEAEAAEGVEFMGQYIDSAIRHYNFADAEHFKKAGSYDWYVQLGEQLTKTDPKLRNEGIAKLNLCGTPPQLVEKIEELQRGTGCDEIIGVFKYGSMPLDKAEKSMRLFADKVLPAVRGFDAPIPNLAAASR